MSKKINLFSLNVPAALRLDQLPGKLEFMSLLPFVGAHHDAPAECLEVNERGVSPCGATYFARDGKVGKTPPGATPERTTVPLTLHLGPQGRVPRTPLRGTHP